MNELWPEGNNNPFKDLEQFIANMLQQKWDADFVSREADWFTVARHGHVIEEAASREMLAGIYGCPVDMVDDVIRVRMADIDGAA